MRRLFTTFGYLVAKQGATAVIGLAYWAVVTHLFSAQDVGLAAAAASTALLLAAFGALGIPLLLLAEIEPIEAAERRVIFTTGLAIAGFVVLILSIGTMALSPFLGKSLTLIGDDPVTAALFVVGSVATMAGLTLDDAGDRAAPRCGAALARQPELHTEACLCGRPGPCLDPHQCRPDLRLGAGPRRLLLRVHADARTWQPTRSGEGALSHRVALVRRFGRLSLQHHVLNLSISSVSFIVPLTATLLISPQQVAYFSAAYLLSATMLIIPYLLALSLFAERSGDPGLLHRHVRRTLPVGLALSVAIVLVVEIAAPYALRLFGPAYAANGTTALRILILVGPAYVIKDHYVSIRRAQGRLTHAAKIMAIGTVGRGRGIGAGRCRVGSHGDLPRLGDLRRRARPCSCSPPCSMSSAVPPPSRSDTGSEPD